MGNLENINRARYMAMLRNKLVDYIKSECSEFDYMIMADLDLAQIPVRTFSTMFDGAFNYVGSMGIEKRYVYDGWAYLDIRGRRNQRPLRISNFARNKIVEVRSCFGGLALVKIQSVLDNYYEPMFGLCEHGGFCSRIQKVGMNTSYRPMRY